MDTLEAAIALAMKGGNDVTPFEIANAIRKTHKLSQKMMQVNSTYTMSPEGRVSSVVWASHDSTLACIAELSDVSNKYTFVTKDLELFESEVLAPWPMSLADCILAANVFMGLIPPHNFAPIDSPNKH